MHIPNRAIWLFANTYVRKKNNFLTNKPRFLPYSIFIFVYGIIQILHLFLINFLFSKKIHKVPDHIVIESAAPHMHLNYFRFFNKNKYSDKFLLIECFNRNQYTKIDRLPFFNLLKDFFDNFKEVVKLLSKLDSNNSKNEMSNLALKSLPIFSYFTTLFENLYRKNDSIEVFSGGADLISSAAIVKNIRTHYLTHGFLNIPEHSNQKCLNAAEYSIIYPRYSSIYTYSIDEKNFLEKYNASNNIKLYPAERLNEFNKSIVIFLSSLDEMMDVQTLEDVISTFSSYQYQIIIKSHPSYNGNISKKISHYKNITFEVAPENSASDLMQEYKPTFALGWLSTSLCEALNLGIVPICLNSRDEIENTKIIYKTKERSYIWKEEKKQLIKALNSGSVKDLIKVF